MVYTINTGFSELSNFSIQIGIKYICSYLPYRRTKGRQFKLSPFISYETKRRLCINTPLLIHKEDNFQMFSMFGMLFYE